MNVEKMLSTTNGLPLQKRTLIHLALVSNKVSEELNNALKPFDISIQQFNVLRILRGQQGKPANLSTINERMVAKTSNTTRLVDKLMGKGLVHRSICPQNRRKVEISITSKGLDALHDIDGIIIATEKNILKNFTNTDLENLNEYLDKF